MGGRKCMALGSLQPRRRALTTFDYYNTPIHFRGMSEECHSFAIKQCKLTVGVLVGFRCDMFRNQWRRDGRFMIWI